MSFRLILCLIVAVFVVFACTPRETVKVGGKEAGLMPRDSTGLEKKPVDTVAVVVSEKTGSTDTLVNLEFKVLKSIADSLFYAERYDDALPYWVKVVAEVTGNDSLECEAHYVLGSIFFQKADYQKAEREFLMSLAADSLLIDAHRDLGLVYFVQGKYEAALASFNRVKSLSPDDPDASYWIDYTRGSAAYESGIKAFAERDLNRAVEQFQIAATYLEADTSANYKIYFYLGKVYTDLFQYDEALSSLLRSVELNPAFSDGYVEIASIYFGLREFEKAIAYNQKALSIHPNSAKALNNLGFIYFTQANASTARNGAAKATKLYESALDLFERALSISPTMGIARNNIHHVKQILTGERTIEALTMMTTASKLEKNSDRIAKYEEIVSADSLYDDAWNNLGVSLFYAGESDRAEDVLRRAVAVNPFNYQAHNNLGLVLGTRHKYDEALRHLFVAIQIRRDYFDAYYNLGYVYMWKEDFESSRKVWLQLLKINQADSQARKGLEEMKRRQALIESGQGTLTIEVHDEESDTESK